MSTSGQQSVSRYCSEPRDIEMLFGGRHNMRERFSMATLLCIGAVLTVGGDLRAADDANPQKFDSPDKVVSAAEDAYGHHDYSTWLDCFSSGGQKQLAGFLIMAEQDTGDAPPPITAPTTQTAAQAEQNKKTAAIFSKYGVRDYTKHVGETADQASDRVLSQIKDLRGFDLEMTTRLLSAPEVPPPFKGKLQGLKITGYTAHATYETKTASGDGVTQDVDFEKVDGSWRIGGLLFFSSPDK